MPIQRLGVVNPAANTDSALATFASQYLVSVVVANKAITASPVTKVSIWVIPPNATVPAQYAYICYNLTLAVGQSFETFRFAVGTGDSLYVRSSTATASFSVNGIAQNDEGQPENTPQTFTNKVIRGLDNTVYIDAGLTSERRASAETGYLRYNTETSKVEVKTNSGWENVGPTTTTQVATTADATTFIALYEDTVGSTGPKVNPDLTYNASTNTLETEALIASSVSAPATITGTYTVASPTTVTLAAGTEIINSSPMRLMPRTVAQLATLTASAGAMVYVTNETGGAVPAFFDGTSWRRVTDRAVVS